MMRKMLLALALVAAGALFAAEPPDDIVWA